MSASSPYSAEKIQLKLKETVNRLDGELGKFKYANEFERRTGVPKSYVALGVAGIGFVMIFFNIAGQLLTNTISWIYPAYASFKAIESPSKEDDKQWLTYWTVIGFVQTIEYFSDILLYWFPFYYLFKTLLVLYLALPQFRGAEMLYARFVRPYLLEAQTDIDAQAEKLKSKISGVFASEKTE
ncbi:hypothetical protein G6F37_000491 [Rhizopus arrhizus]|nr:hypothetical protein G6F38_000082 [Rhizopus arrhizus]KAG1164201.1 hypothetical protein G6F37_000491 [Rhizopus arrhizus]